LPLWSGCKPMWQVQLGDAPPVAAHLALLWVLNNVRQAFLAVRNPQCNAHGHAQFTKAMVLVGQMFKFMNWKPTLWIHILVRHGSQQLKAHGSWSHLSTVPTEAAHKTYKLELRSVLSMPTIYRCHACLGTG